MPQMGRVVYRRIGVRIRGVRWGVEGGRGREISFGKGGTAVVYRGGGWTVFSLQKEGGEKDIDFRCTLHR